MEEDEIACLYTNILPSTESLQCRLAARTKTMYTSTVSIVLL